MRSIRAKFTTLTVALVIVALAVVTAIGVLSIRKLGRSNADQVLHLTCATGAKNLEHYFSSVEGSVNTVASLVSDSLRGTSEDQLADQVEQSKQLFNNLVENTSGVHTYYFRIDPMISGTTKGYWYVKEGDKGFKEHEVTDINLYDTNDTSALVWFTIPKMTGEPVWLPPYYTETINERVISYNVPVYRDGRFVGVIGIEIDYDTLVDEVGSIKLYDSGYAFILGENSKVIYHPQLDEERLDLETTALEDSDDYVGSNHVRYTYQGTSKEAVWMPLSNGMDLYVCAPEKEIDHEWHLMIARTIIASLIVLLITIFIMMSFAGRFTKPLTELTKAARKVDSGDYDFDLDYDENDEVGILTNAFKQLAAHTKENITSLNKRVYVDPLTSVRNKAAYGNYIHALQDRLDDTEDNPVFAFGVFDCDDLKMINDTYGHDKGDIYLKTASKLICQIFRHSPVFRIGGDEFAVILENEDFDNRDKLIAEFRQARTDLSEAAENPWEEVHITMGVAVYDPEDDMSVMDVARHADRRMYEKKRYRKDQRNGGSD